MDRRSAALLCCCIAGLTLAGCASPPVPLVSAGAAPAPVEKLPAAEPPTATVERLRLGAGGTLDRALADLGLEGGLRGSLVAALAEELELRRLSPATGLALTRDAAGALRSVACRSERTSFVRVKIDGRGAVEGVERVEVPRAVVSRSVGGIIESSVGETFADHELGIELTQRYADIFQWDVDLFVDPRPGDVVRLVYEELRLGQPPADLPPFGEDELSEGASLGIGRVLAASYDGRQVRSSAYFVEDDGRGGNFYDRQGRSLRKAFLKSPLNYRRISSRFSRGRRHPITRKVVPHHGVDFAAASGTPVVAAADGTVVGVGWEGALGRAVRLRHPNGFVTVYGHLRGYARGVRRGARIEQNQVVGYVGSTGRATGPHLHYTMLDHGRPIDPLRFANPSIEPLHEDRRDELAAAVQSFTPLLYSLRLGDATRRASLVEFDVTL